MGIPYGTTYTATVTGSALKTCRCEACDKEYVYKVERSSAGSGTSVLWLDNDGAQRRAEQEAQRLIEKELANAVDAVACPSCGWFQANMVSILKRRKLYWALGLSLPVALGLFMWGMITSANFRNNTPTLLTAAAVVGVLGIVAGVLWQMLHDPNRDHGTPRASELAAASVGTPMEAFQAEMDAERAKSFDVLRQTLLLMLMADGSPEEQKLQAVVRIYEQITDQQLSSHAVRDEARAAAERRDEIAAQLAQAGNLSDQGKAMFIQANLAVAAADGAISDAEWDVLGLVAAGLQMTSLQVRGVIESMQQPA